ncbi:MAG: hypothetical protein ACHQIL_00940 [Steroidobacterales bacterium]
MKLIQLTITDVALLCAVAVQAADGTVDGKSEIAWALSAAPPSIAAGADVVTVTDDGKFKELRSGSNGWTCIVHDPGTPKGHPLCLDKNGLEWMATAMSEHAPDPDKTGYSYMLKGGTVWSNTDVTAMSLPAGQKDFIRIPPHVMIMNAKIANSSGFPSGQMYPDTHKPFVLFGGTPYAILIMPLK